MQETQLQLTLLCLQVGSSRWLPVLRWLSPTLRQLQRPWQDTKYMLLLLARRVQLRR